MLKIPLLYAWPCTTICDLRTTSITPLLILPTLRTKMEIPGEWRLQKENDLNNNAVVDLPRVRGSRSRHDALETRNELRDFLPLHYAV